MINPNRKWGWYEQVTYFQVRQRWPQLYNYLEGQQLFCSKDFDTRVRFSKLKEIAISDTPSHKIKVCDLIPLITEFKVASWPKPAWTREKIELRSLSAEQRQRWVYICYWLGVNLVPLNPKYHAPISQHYEGSNGRQASVGIPKISFRISTPIPKRWGRK